MADLNMRECDHLMGIWKICYKCEATIQENNYSGYTGYVDGCKCLYHHECAVARVRKNHSCSLEFKRQIITNYVKKTFSTDDVRGAYKTHEQKKLLSLMDEENSSNLSEEECETLMMCWRICYVCEVEVEGSSNQIDTKAGYIKTCQCLFHEGCHAIRVRQRHSTSSCSLQLKMEIVINYVRKTYQTDNVRAAFKTYMERNLPLLAGPLGSQFIQEQCSTLKDEKTFGMAKLREENRRQQQELTEARQSCEELRKKIARLQEENFRLNQEKDEEKQQMAQILAGVEGETEHFKQKWTELQEKYNRLEQLNENLHNDIQSSKVESEMQREQFENEKKEMVSEKNEIQEQLNRTSGKNAKINCELEEMKRKWMVTATDGFESKEKAFDESNDTAPDECILKFEMDSFQQLFNETQMKISELGKKSFSTRNNKLRKELTQKISPSTEISCEVEDEIVTVLKKEGEKLKTVLENLLSIETEFPSASSNRRNDHGDANLLD